MSIAIGLDDQIRAVEREIGRRERSYPQFIAERKMIESAARHELAAMRAILATLKSIKETQGA